MSSEVPSANVTVVFPVSASYLADRTCLASARRSSRTANLPGEIRTIHLFSRQVVRLPSHQAFSEVAQIRDELVEHLVEVSLPDCMFGRRYAHHSYCLRFERKPKPDNPSCLFVTCVNVWRTVIVAAMTTRAPVFESRSFTTAQ
jgi:hypothetical protein